MNDNPNNTNGFSSKDMLYHIWNKIESIEIKLDAKLSELDKRVIILELEAIKRDGPFVSDLKLHEERLNSIETHLESQQYSDSILKEQKSDLFNNRNIIIGGIATAVILIQFILTLIQHF